VSWENPRFSNALRRVAGTPASGSSVFVITGGWLGGGNVAASRSEPRPRVSRVPCREPETRRSDVTERALRTAPRTERRIPSRLPGVRQALDAPSLQNDTSFARLVRPGRPTSSRAPGAAWQGGLAGSSSIWGMARSARAAAGHAVQGVGRPWTPRPPAEPPAVISCCNRLRRNLAHVARGRH
jgi:hypothetical protein